MRKTNKTERALSPIFDRLMNPRTLIRVGALIDWRDMKTSEALYGGAEYIARNGHHKGTYLAGAEEGTSDQTMARLIEEQRPACMLGGTMAWAYRRRASMDDAWEANNRVISRVASLTPPLIIPMFNDGPSTTAEDAILRMKELGRLFEEKGD